VDPGVLQNDKLERGVEHREQRAYGAQLLAARPFAGTVARLQGNPHRDEADRSVAAFEQQDVLIRPLRRLKVGRAVTTSPWTSIGAAI